MSLPSQRSSDSTPSTPVASSVGLAGDQPAKLPTNDGSRLGTRAAVSRRGHPEPLVGSFGSPGPAGLFGLGRIAGISSSLLICDPLPAGRPLRHTAEYTILYSYAPL